jgi:hypothetical protein
MDFIETVSQSNRLAVEKVDSGYILTISNSESNDNAATCFVLNGDVIMWEDYENDEEGFDRAVSQLGNYDNEVERTIENLEAEDSPAARALAEAMRLYDERINAIDAERVDGFMVEDIPQDSPPMPAPIRNEGYVTYQQFQPTWNFQTDTTNAFPDFSAERGVPEIQFESFPDESPVEWEEDSEG